MVLFINLVYSMMLCILEKIPKEMANVARPGKVWVKGTICFELSMRIYGTFESLGTICSI